MNFPYIEPLGTSNQGLHLCAFFNVCMCRVYDYVQPGPPSFTQGSFTENHCIRGATSSLLSMLTQPLGKTKYSSLNLTNDQTSCFFSILLPSLLPSLSFRLELLLLPLSCPLDSVFAIIIKLAGSTLRVIIYETCFVHHCCSFFSSKDGKPEKPLKDRRTRALLLLACLARNET